MPEIEFETPDPPFPPPFEDDDVEPTPPAPPPPPPTVIDLTVESIEDMMMADVQEQKAASDNETSENQPKATKGKRKHIATGNPRGRPPRDPNKDGDRDKGQGLA